MEQYTNIEYEIIFFDSEDVITDSTCVGQTGEGDCPFVS